MYKVTLRKIFSNSELLSEDLDEEDFEEQSFSYKVKRDIKIDFIPQIGSCITVDGVYTLVQDLNFNVNNQSISITHSYDVPVEDTAILMVKKLLKAGWSTY
jgi:hypothetical protein